MTLVFNGWAAEASTWDGCRFPRRRVFSYLDHLAGDSLRAVAEATEGVVLVGFSMGASFVLKAIAEYPEKILGAVLVSATPRMMAEMPDWPGLTPRRKAALKLGTQLMHGAGGASEIFDEANLDRGLDYLERTDLRAELEPLAGRTRFPVAIFHSRRDGIVRPHNAEYLRRIFPQATLTWVEGTEHDLPRKIPALIDRAVEGIRHCSRHLARGLIEVSNICQKDCSYCGIRRGLEGVRRYHMSVEEVLECVRTAVARGYPGIALQAGELESEANTSFYETVLAALAGVPGAEGLEVTLSLGEQTEDAYRRWKSAAGDRVLRYLLRIETSNRELYAKLHPADHSFDRRLECIRTLKRLGYVTGSGVMIGIPGQTDADLGRDLDFYEEERLDMVGMGPYIADEECRRRSAALREGEWSDAAKLEKTLWMIRETRRRMPLVNIVSSTALEVIAPGGRELGFANGANVFMPNLTPERFRADYRLYPGKSLKV